MNVTVINDRLTLEDFNDVIPNENAEIVKNYILNFIVNNCLMSIIGDIRQDSRYDFVYNSKIIEENKKYLKDSEKFFNEKTENALKNITNLCVIVDNEDYYTEHYVNQTITEDEIKYLIIAPTYITFDEFSRTFTEYTKLNDFNLKIKIHNVIENFYTTNQIEGDIQIGGFIIYPIQLGYENLIGYYYGDYGDCGALYVYLNDKNQIYSTVNMH